VRRVCLYLITVFDIHGGSKRISKCCDLTHMYINEFGMILCVGLLVFD